MPRLADDRALAVVRLRRVHGHTEPRAHPAHERSRRILDVDVVLERIHLRPHAVRDLLEDRDEPAREGILAERARQLVNEPSGHTTRPITGPCAAPGTRAHPVPTAGA